MLDDEILGAAFHETGDSFAVPVRGAADILQRIEGGDDRGAGRGQALADPPDSSDAAGPADPADAADAAGRGDAAPTIRSWKGVVRSHRVLSVAASVLLLLALAGGAVLWGNSTPANRTANRTAAHTAAGTPAGTNAATNPPVRAPSKAAHAGSPTFSPASPATGAVSGNSAAAAPPASSTSGTSGATSGKPSTTTPALPAGEVGQSARIEQTGSLDLTVAKGSLSATMGKLSSLAAEYDGFVANLQTQSGGTGGGPPSGTITLQIPVASFSAALAGAQSLGKASQLSTKATDVTGQYVDLQDQITALEASRQQYLTIMTRASSIGDVLAVQAQLDSLQSQIQQLQGQLQVLSSETAYSTLTVTAREAGPVHHPPVPVRSSSLAKAWHDSVHGFIVGMEGLVRIAGPVLFVLLCVGALVIGGRLSWRRLQRHNL